MAATGGRRLIVEADGGSRGNPGPAAYGAVVRDQASGRVLVEVADAIGVATNNVAEYRGLLAGLEQAHALAPEAAVDVRLDSRLIVEQMSGTWAIKNATLRPLALACRAVFPPGRTRYQWVPREQNRHADRLVNEALDAAVRGRPAAILRRFDSAQGPGEAIPGVAADDVVGEAEVAEAAAEAAAQAEAAPSDRAHPPNRLVGWAPDLGTPTVMLLVRHGATPASLEKRFSGAGGSDPALAPVGEAQAAALAVELTRRGPVDVIVSSPLRRTRQTAAAIAAATGAAIEVEPELAECAFGAWDGRTFAEVRRRWPVELEAWLASPDVPPPGGESFAQCRARVDRARRRILAQHPSRRVVVVSHVSPIKLAVGLAIDAPLHSLYRMELAPCSITTIAWYADGIASLAGFAEAAHLRGVDVPAGT